jgi:hypothetical protein
LGTESGLSDSAESVPVGDERWRCVRERNCSRRRATVRTERYIEGGTGRRDVMMDGSTLMTVVMVALMVVMMGGMVVGAGWAVVRRWRQRDD